MPKKFKFLIPGLVLLGLIPSVAAASSAKGTTAESDVVVMQKFEIPSAERASQSINQILVIKPSTITAAPRTATIAAGVSTPTQTGYTIQQPGVSGVTPTSVLAPPTVITSQRSPTSPELPAPVFQTMRQAATALSVVEPPKPGSAQALAPWQLPLHSALAWLKVFWYIPGVLLALIGVGVVLWSKAYRARDNDANQA